METLGKLFNSTARVKIMRLFLFNDMLPFDIDDIAKRSKVTKPTVKKEVKVLSDIGFLKKTTFTKEVVVRPSTKTTKTTKSKNGAKKTTTKKTAQKKIVSKKVKGWVVDPSFQLTHPLRTLLLDSELVKKKELPDRFKHVGNIKMMVLSGIFMRDDERKVDLLIVGEKLDEKKIGRTMASIEAEIGKELRYTIFDPQEFKYRLEMYDQHLLDIFEYPHERIVDKLKMVS